MHKEISNHSTFLLLQVSELFSTPTQIIVTVSYGTQIQKIYENNLLALYTIVGF